MVYGTSVGFVKKFKFDKRHPSVQTLKEKHSSPIITIKVTSSGIVVSGRSKLYYWLKSMNTTSFESSNEKVSKVFN